MQDGHAFVSSPNAINIPGYKKFDIPENATLPGLNSGIIGAHTSILRDLETFQDQVVLMLQEAGMHSGAYAQPHPVRDAHLAPDNAPAEWHGLPTAQLAEVLSDCFKAEKDLANVLASRAANEVAIEHLLLTAGLLRQKILQDSAQATLTYKHMEDTIQELATKVKENDLKGISALKLIIRHFRPIMAAYEATATRQPPPLETAPGVPRQVHGNIPYDGPQQGFTSIDAIPKLLFHQAPVGQGTNMTIDSEATSSSQKRGAEGDIRTPAPPSGGDDGWNIFRNTTPFLLHEGVKVTPARYYLDLNYPEAPTGASKVLAVPLLAEALPRWFACGVFLSERSLDLERSGRRLGPLPPCSKAPLFA